MRKILAVSFAALVCLLPFSVAFAGNEDGWKFNFNTEVISQWLGEPGGIIIYNRPAIRNQLTFSKGKYYGGVWISIGLNDKGIHHRADFGDEVDLFFGIHQPFEFLEIDLSAKYFALNDLRNSEDDALVIDGQFDFPTQLFTPYLAVRYWGEIGNKSLERGWFFRPGIKKSFLVLKRVGINFDTSLTFSDGPMGKDPGFICGTIKVSSDLKINERVSVSPFVVFQLPSSSQDGGNKDFTGNKSKEVMFGISLNFEF